MKHLKKFEGYIDNSKLPENSLKIGDYVLLQHSDLNPIRDEINVYQIVQAYVYTKEKKDSPTRITFKIRKYKEKSKKSDTWKYPQYLDYLTNKEEKIDSELAQRKYNL